MECILSVDNGLTKCLNASTVLEIEIKIKRLQLCGRNELLQKIYYWI